MNRGFSLVELSIVLVILGLLTGGILGGQSLIRAAEIRGITTDQSRYSTAVQSFRDKYFSVPGDMANATAFWGAATSCPGEVSTPSTGTATCNGNGDGRLQHGAATANEPFRLWHHLANAGLIEGSYTGVSNSATTSGTDILFGSNLPRGRMSNSGMMVLYLGDIAAANTTYFEGSYSHTLYYGASNPACCPSSALLKPEEMWNIDTKVDDGKPGTGAVLSFESYGPSLCHTQTPGSTAASSANYNLAGTSVGCALLFKNFIP